MTDMSKLKTATILYVDDEEANRVVFQASFEDRFHIELADSGESALLYLERHEVAVIVSDQRMAGLKGNELLDIVRKRWPRTIRMIVTAYQDVDAILRAVNDGLVARYLVKPWDEAEFVDILEWGLEAYSLAFEHGGERLQDRLLESEKLAALGGLQASFLHELGTPLAYIYGSVGELKQLVDHSPELLALIANDTTRPPQHWHRLQAFLSVFPEILENLETGASLLTHLRDDVHSLVKSNTSKDRNLCSGNEVERAGQFAMTVNKRDAVLANATLRFEAPSQIPDLKISAKDLMLVLINLTRNAIQSLPAARSGNEVVLSLDTDTSPGLARISVSDNGMGMTGTVANTIGKQFYTTREAGTGLGVFRCRALLGNVGGSLEYDSKVGAGTTATAVVPASTPI